MSAKLAVASALGIICGALVGHLSPTPVFAWLDHTERWPTQWWTNWSYIQNGSSYFKSTIDGRLVDEYNQNTSFTFTKSKIRTCRDAIDNGRWLDFRRMMSFNDYINPGPEDGLGHAAAYRVVDNLLGPVCPVVESTRCIIPGDSTDKLEIWGVCNRSSLKTHYGVIELNREKLLASGQDWVDSTIIHEVGHLVGMGHTYPKGYGPLMLAACAGGDDPSIMWEDWCMTTFINNGHSVIDTLTTPDVLFIDSIH